MNFVEQKLSFADFLPLYLNKNGIRKAIKSQHLLQVNDEALKNREIKSFKRNQYNNMNVENLSLQKPHLLTMVREVGFHDLDDSTTIIGRKVLEEKHDQLSETAQIICKLQKQESYRSRTKRGEKKAMAAKNWMNHVLEKVGFKIVPINPHKNLHFKLAALHSQYNQSYKENDGDRQVDFEE